MRNAARSTTVVANRYELVSEVARGGCGAVYEAVDLESEGLVAVKILQADALDKAAKARFAREARVASAIHHPNVCTVSDAGMLDDGSPFLVMERLYGETLRGYVSRMGGLDPEDAIELAVQMLSGLEAAHDLGIVHRDMKPENVFVVRPEGSTMPLVKLLDFGMCRRQSGQPMDDRTLTRVGTVVGTPEYMAPEQASGRRDFDLRIDLYAVGVMLWEMVAGTRAFYGADARAVLISVLARQLPSIRVARPDLPIALDRIVARAVERDPRARYRNAAEFQNDLLHARTAMRRQRSLRLAADERMRGLASTSQGSEWDLPTRHLAPRTAYRRQA
jgi:serine/threonine protein kinase